MRGRCFAFVYRAYQSLKCRAGNVSRFLFNLFGMKNISFLLILLFAVSGIFAQNLPPDSTQKPPPDSIQVAMVGMELDKFPFLKTLPPSPEAASIGKYGSLPVSLYSGTTSLQVPFHTLESGKLQIPVGLSYHSAAMKVGDISGSVGTGWSLQAGGVITRVMQGSKADEDGSNGFLNKSIPSSSDTEAYGCFKGQVDDGTVDGLADDFYYNFNGRSGRFKYSNYTSSGTRQTTDTPVLMSDAALKIEWLSTRKRFKVTDEDGTMYIFGLSLSNEIAYEQTTTSNNVNLNSYTHTSAWYLTEMISADRIDTVRFKYSSPTNSLQPPLISTTLVRTKLSRSSVPTYAYQYGQRNQSIQTVNLTSIETKNGRIGFEYTADRQDTPSLDKRLRRIILYNAAGTSLKRLELIQSYFGCADGRSQVEIQGNSPVPHPISSYLRKRLRLDTAEYKSGTGLTVSAYSFEYNEAEPLPIYGALAQDFWGYYNGAASNKHLLLKDINHVNDFEPLLQNGSDRTPYFNKTLLGSLSKITYPTGGTTEISYEANRHPISNVLGGGIRVKQLTDRDAAGNTTARVFNYTWGYYTSNLFSGNYATLSSESVRTFETEETGCPTTNDNTQTSYRESLNYSIGTSSGSGISYNVIEESPFNSTNSTITGKTVYEYPIVQDFTVPIYQYVQYLRGWQRDFLEKKTVYKGSGSIFMPVSEEIYTYSRTVLPNISKGFSARMTYDNISSGFVCGLPRTTTFYCTLYDKNDIYDSFESEETSERILLTQTIQKTFDESGSNPVSVTQQYEYANLEHLQPTKSTTYRSSGVASEKVIKYPHELSNGNNVYSEMVSRHIYSPVIEEQWYEGGSYLKSRRTNYKLWHPSVNFGDVLGFHAPFSVEEQYAGGSWRTELVMGEKLDNPVNSGFNTRARPVLYTLRSGLTTSLGYFDIAGKKDLLQTKNQHGQVTTYDYEPTVGLKKQTLPNGLATSYGYDFFQRLQRVTDNQMNVADYFSYLYATTAPVPSNISWGANSCTNTDNVNSVFTVSVNGLGTGATASFSLDGTNYFPANVGNNAYQVSVPFGSGGTQNFWARPSDNPSQVIFGTLTKCGFSGGVAAPTISVTSSTLCNVTLTASNCSGTVNWSNGSSGSSISVPSANSSTYSATCTVGSTTSTASNSLAVPVLPSDWNSTDIGPSTTACVQVSGGNLTMRSNGGIGGTGNPDNFHYVYKSMSEDFTLIAKISSLIGNSNDRAGFMIRSDLGTQAPDFTLFQDGGVSNNYAVGTFHRLTQGTDNTFGSFKGGVLNATWIRIIKTGNNFEYSYRTSDNGVWMNDFSIVNGSNPQPVNVGSNYLLGFATWGNATQATFSNITINGQPF